MTYIRSYRGVMEMLNDGGAQAAASSIQKLADEKLQLVFDLLSSKGTFSQRSIIS
jgi:hypothetical protein